MLAELLEKLSEQAVGAAAPQIQESDPTKMYAVRKPDGTVDFIGGRVPWRKHKAQDLETIAAFAEDHSDAAIWYSRDNVIILTDDGDRRDRVTVEMLKTKQVLALLELDAKRPKYGQREFLFFIRTVLTKGAFPTNPSLIDSLRVVNFEAQEKAEGNLQRGKISVGKSLNAAVAGLDAVPEFLVVEIPLFDNPFLTDTFPIECALEIYEDEKKFQLFPLPGEVEAAFCSAEAKLSKNIRDLLGTESKVPVYYGKP